MKTHTGRVLGTAISLLAASAAVPLGAQTPLPPEPLLNAQLDTPLSWQITQRDFHSATWESAVPVVDPVSGKTRFERHKFVSIGSGMNFWDEESQSFQPTREEFSI